MEHGGKAPKTLKEGTYDPTSKTSYAWNGKHSKVDTHTNYTCCNNWFYNLTSQLSHDSLFGFFKYVAKNQRKRSAFWGDRDNPIKFKKDVMFWKTFTKIDVERAPNFSPDISAGYQEVNVKGTSHFHFYLLINF